jgi:transcriptional regulator with XRE-family HTH domain
MDELEQKLEELGWSQAELGRRIRVSQTTVTNWVRGRHSVPYVVLKYLDLLLILRREIK